MGNNASLPEKVFAAVQRNDVCGFQALVSDFGTAGLSDPAARALVLEYKDKYGRTPLLVAAAKNHYQILQQLISLGADVHYINPARDSAGGALHEAAARRHEAAVELLLAARANPFAANAGGRTALDEAVLSGHPGVVRAIEKNAEFTGMVAFKTRSMAGLSSKYKARWAVLMPYYPFSRDAMGAASGTAGSGQAAASVAAAAKPRRCLWLYKDPTSISPRCRLWVDGATVATHGPAGTEGTLRLHTSHGEPVGDLSTTFSHGYCISMRPADLTPVSAAVYHRLVELLNTRTPNPPRQQLPTIPASPPPPSVATAARPNAVAYSSPFPPQPASPQAPVPTDSASLYPPVIPVSVYGAPGGVPPAAPQQAPPYPGAAGPCPMASPLSLYQHQHQSAGPAGTTSGAPSPPRPSEPAPALVGRSEQQHQRQQEEPWPPQQQQQLRVRVPEGRNSLEAALGSGGQVIGERFIERMAALPGESDEAFAARLASAISATSGQSQQHLYPLQPTNPSASPHAAAAAAQASSAPLHHFHNAYPQGPGSASPSTAGATPHLTPAASLPQPEHNLINFQSDPGGPNTAWEAGPSGSRPVGQQVSFLRQEQDRPQRQSARGSLDDLDMDAVNELIAAEAAAAGRAPTGSSAPASGGGTQMGNAGLPPSKQELPSAPPAPAGSTYTTPERPRAPLQPDNEAECIICLSAPKEVGFLHGDSVHRCVCRECSARVRVGTPCPLCRQPVERVIGVY